MKSRGILIGALAAGFVVIFWYMMVYSKGKDDVSSTKSQVSEAQQQTEELTQQKEQLEGLADEGSGMAAKLDLLHAAVPADAELAKFIDEADALGAEAGVDWVSVSPSEPMVQNGVGTIQLTIQVSGGYFKVLDYLDNIEGMSRLVVIDSISATESASAEGGSGATGPSNYTEADGPRLSVALTGRMFTQAVPNTAPAPGADAANSADATTPTTLATTNVAEG